MGTTINNVGQTVSYDPLSRITQAVNPLGTFQYTYVDTTNRPLLTTYPNGQTCKYSYYPNVGDQRLQQIQNFAANSTTTTLSNLSYFLVETALGAF